jgi:hypothetical protein
MQDGALADDEISIDKMQKMLQMNVRSRYIEDMRSEHEDQILSQGSFSARSNHIASHEMIPPQDTNEEV